MASLKVECFEQVEILQCKDHILQGEAITKLFLRGFVIPNSFIGNFWQQHRHSSRSAPRASKQYSMVLLKVEAFEQMKII